MGVRHVVVLGLMGSGKSSIGRPLGARLGIPYLDNDDVLTERAGLTAREIAEARGTGALHAEEAAAFEQMLAEPEPAVLGGAASVVADPAIRAQLRDQFVVWLDTDLDFLAQRVGAKPHRPSLGGDVRTALQEQWDERAPFFREVASLTLHPEREDDEQSIEEILRALR